MKITYKDGDITLTITADELGIIRYALNTGTEKLQSTASYLKAMKSKEYENANETAQRAALAREALETACKDWIGAYNGNST